MSDLSEAAPEVVVVAVAGWDTLWQYRVALPLETDAIPKEGLPEHAASRKYIRDGKLDEAELDGAMSDLIGAAGDEERVGRRCLLVAYHERLPLVAGRVHYEEGRHVRLLSPVCAWIEPETSLTPGAHTSRVSQYEVSFSVSCAGGLAWVTGVQHGGRRPNDTRKRSWGAAIAALRWGDKVLCEHLLAYLLQQRVDSIRQQCDAAQGALPGPMDPDREQPGVTEAMAERAFAASLLSCSDGSPA